MIDLKLCDMLRITGLNEKSLTNFVKLLDYAIDLPHSLLGE